MYGLGREKLRLLHLLASCQSSHCFFLIGTHASNDLRFAAAVAEYGMLLRDSQFKQDSKIEQVISMAKKTKGDDDNGYRAEFIRLAESTRDMMKTTAVTAAK